MRLCPELSQEALFPRRNAYEAANNIPYPNGYHDIRRYVPGNVSAGVSVIARMCVTSEQHACMHACAEPK